MEILKYKWVRNIICVEDVYRKTGYKRKREKASKGRGILNIDKPRREEGWRKDFKDLKEARHTKFRFSQFGNDRDIRKSSYN